MVSSRTRIVTSAVSIAATETAAIAIAIAIAVAAASFEEEDEEGRLDRRSIKELWRSQRSQEKKCLLNISTCLSVCLSVRLSVFELTFVLLSLNGFFQRGQTDLLPKLSKNGLESLTYI